MDKGAIAAIVTIKVVTGSLEPETPPFLVALFIEQKKTGSIMTLPKYFRKVEYYFLFFLSLAPARPTKPVPNKSIVAGSGTGAVVTNIPATA